MGRKKMSDEAKAKSSASKRERALFDRYMTSVLNGPKAGRWGRQRRMRIGQIEKQLLEGTKERRPRGGQPYGESVSLLPSDRAELLAEKKRLLSLQEAGGAACDELRRKFRDMLPGYMKRLELSAEEMLSLGVPAEDIEDASRG